MPNTTSPSKRQLALHIVKELKKHGHEAYFVGGCVRDMLLKKRPSDFDISTSAIPSEVEKIFKKTIPVGKAFGVIIVRYKEQSFEVATFRKDMRYVDGRRPTKVKFSNAKEDSLRRDFTVNGLFLDPTKNKVLDWVGGEKDLKKQLIRTIGEPQKRFREDKLRMIRAIRFAVNLNFKLEKKTLDAIKKMYRDIQQVSQERIRDELIKIFTGPDPVRGLDLLDESNLLKIILPEVEKLKGVKQPPEYHPEGDVFKHTRLILKYLKKPDIVLAFSALLHDIGKPKTFYKAKDRIRFNGHDKVGAKMADKVLERLRFSNDLKKKITTSVEYHMQFKDAKQMKESTLKRMFQRSTFVSELEQHKADCLASHGNLQIWRFLKKKLQSFSEEEIKPKPMLMGKDLVTLGMSPGPKFGKILKEASDLQLEGKFKSKKDALDWAKKRSKST